LFADNFLEEIINHFQDIITFELCLYILFHNKVKWMVQDDSWFYISTVILNFNMDDHCLNVIDLVIAPWQQQQLAPDHQAQSGLHRIDNATVLTHSGWSTIPMSPETQVTTFRGDQ